MKATYQIHLAVKDEDKEHIDYIKSKIKISLIGIFRYGIAELLEKVKEEENNIKE